ncbi:MAG: hypothetical protein O7A67_08970 [SAR324 cluster bacterium]|nr:hypothetical protein [SAR324 cluster bacterium]
MSRGTLCRGLGESAAGACFRSSGLLAFFLSALAIPLAAAAQGDRGPSLTFVRGGIVVEWDLPAEETPPFTLNGRAAARRPLGAEGSWLVETAWAPQETYTLAWIEGGAERSLRAAAPLRPMPWRVWWIDWSADPRQRAGISALAFAPGGRRLAIGSFDGRVRVVETATGQTRWTLHRPGRVIKHLQFAEAGGRLYVGEQGPRGILAAYDLAGERAEPLWRFESAQELGTSQPADPQGPLGWVTYPGVYRIAARGGDVLAAFTRSWPRNGRRATLARLVRLDGASGRVRWAYPADGPATQMLTWFDVDAAGRNVVFPLQLPFGSIPRPGGGEESKVVVLDGATGIPRFGSTVAPLPPHYFAAFWRGVAFDPGGRRLALSTEDGRGFLYIRDGETWRETRRLLLVEPMELGGVVVTATNGTLAATAAGPLFATGETYVPLEYRSPDAEPVAEHPQSNTLFGLDWAGNTRWLWRLDADLMGLSLSADEATLALAQGHEIGSRPRAFQGLAVLDLSRPGSGRNKLRYRYPIEGRAVYDGVAISPAGRWIALAEAPLTDRKRGLTRGAHRVHLIR